VSAQRAIAWRHGYHALVCSSAEPWAHGTVVRALDVPTYYDDNLAPVEAADPGSDAATLAAAAEPALAGLGHRRARLPRSRRRTRAAPATR